MIISIGKLNLNFVGLLHRHVLEDSSLSSLFKNLAIEFFSPLFLQAGIWIRFSLPFLICDPDSCRIFNADLELPFGLDSFRVLLLDLQSLVEVSYIKLL